MAYENAGYSYPMSQKACDEIYVGNQAKGGNWYTTTSTRVHSSSDGKSGGRYRSVVKVPKSGELKKASTDIPYWTVASNIDTSHIQNNNNLRSGSVQEVEYQKAYYESVSDMLERKDTERDTRKRIKNQSRILSAQSGIPGWAVASNCVV